MCVFKMISATRGSFWCMYVRIPSTQPGCQPAPPPGIRHREERCTYALLWSALPQFAVPLYCMSVFLHFKSLNLTRSHPPPPQRAKMFRGCRCRGLHLGAPYAQNGRRDNEPAHTLNGVWGSGAFWPTFHPIRERIKNLQPFPRPQ